MASNTRMTVIATPITTTPIADKDTTARRPAITATATRKESNVAKTKKAIAAAPVKETTRTTTTPPKPPKTRADRPAPGAAFKAAAQARKDRVAAEEPKRKPKERKPKEFTPEQQEAFAARQKSRTRIDQWLKEGRPIGFFMVRGARAGPRATHKAGILRSQIPGVKIHVAAKGDAKVLTVAFPVDYISEEIAVGWARGRPLEFPERGWDATEGPVIRVSMHDASKPAKVAVPRLAVPRLAAPKGKQWDHHKNYPDAFTPEGDVLRVHGDKDMKLHNQPTGAPGYQRCASTPAKPCRQNVDYFKAVRAELAKGISPADLAKGWLEEGTIKLPSCCWRAHRTLQPLQQCGVTEDVYPFFCETFKIQKKKALAYEAGLVAKKEAKAAELAARAEAKKPDEDGFVDATAIGKTYRATATAAHAGPADAKHGGRFAALVESESEDETAPPPDHLALAGAACEEEWSESEDESEWPDPAEAAAKAKAKAEAKKPSAPTGAWGISLP